MANGMVDLLGFCVSDFATRPACGEANCETHRPQLKRKPRHDRGFLYVPNLGCIRQNLSHLRIVRISFFRATIEG